MNRTARRKLVSNIMMGLTAVCAFLTVSTLFLILGYLLWNGGNSVNWAFFTQLPKPTGEEGGGMANAILGTAEIVGLASLMGIPIGFFGGIFLNEFSGPVLAFFIRYTADLLNGVPSIIIGVLAWTIVVKPMHTFGALGGAVGLAVMLIPFGLRSTEQFLHSVPVSLREGSLALGAGKWKTIISVVVPAAIRGIATGMILGVARIAGETAPLLFTSGTSQYWSNGISQPIATLPVMVYYRAISPYDDYHRQAWAAGLVLLGLVLTANILARIIINSDFRMPQWLQRMVKPKPKVAAV